MSVRISLLSLVAIVGSAVSASAQTNYKWDFSTLTPNSTGNSNLLVSDFGIRPTSTGGLDSSSPSTGYPGASGGNNLSIRAQAVGALDLANSAYFSIFVTPLNGFSGVTLSEISFGSRSTGSGPASITIRSSALNNFGSDIVSPLSTPTDSTWRLFTPTATASQIISGSGNAIEFRVYGYDGSGSNSVNWRIDDFSISFTPVPEPGTMFGLGAAVLSLGAFVRKRFNKAAQAEPIAV
jgi:PEP-CTERM motif